MRNFYIITGHNRVGKTTLARLLRNNLETREAPHHTAILPFGEYLKKELEANGFPRIFIDEKSPESRALMRSHGAARRSLDNNHFVAQWEREAAGFINNHGSNTSIISDDVYHHNELAAMARMAASCNAALHIIVVRRDGFRPDEEALKSPSVKEAEEIIDIFGILARENPTVSNPVFGRDLPALAYEDGSFYKYHITPHYTQEDVRILSTARIVFVYNEYRTPESYTYYLQGEIIPQLT